MKTPWPHSSRSEVSARRLNHWLVSVKTMLSHLGSLQTESSRLKGCLHLRLRLRQVKQPLRTRCFSGGVTLLEVIPKG